MAKNLVIVESPAKAKTISRFLGADYQVLASMGHVRDLPKSKMGIDTEHDFEPTYSVSPDKKKVISEISAALKKADELWLATDEDREGEAIGWHLLHALKVNTKKTPVHRIVFHEITESAIKDSLTHPREIDQNVVDAQQARRILDRLVGYELSPLLWKKIRYGLSAGRVQSVAVRLIVEREREINAFVPEEYWSIEGIFKNTANQTFSAVLQKFEDKKISVKNDAEASKILQDLQGANYKVSALEQKEVNRHPAPPFITSTLQQEASRKLGFSVKKTMMIAQQLYEGVEIGTGQTGLITYMRTDSVNLAQQALRQAKEVIEKEFGHEYALETPRYYKGRKRAQEAHEAIRPVDLTLKPEYVAQYLSKDQLKLYDLIWKRALACQMAPAILNQTAADISANNYTFRATGQSIKFAGFIKVYLEGHDTEEEDKEDDENFLPPLAEGESVSAENITKNQHFTKPPARYTEASLVKKLEAEGIGRPSTYAPTIGTIMTRGYIEKEGKALRPTDIAMIVTDMLTDNFPQIVDYQFTAEMEDKLDLIEEGKEKWVPVIRNFYDPFHTLVELKNEALQKSDILHKNILGIEPVSGLEVIVRHGRFGSYVQLGEWNEEDRKNKVNTPRRASIPKGQNFETVTLEEALKLLDFPRQLGQNATGEDVSVNLGPYGPYIKVGKANYSLPETYSPTTVQLSDLDNVIAEEKAKRELAKKPLKELGANPETNAQILIKTGRFGPYVTDGKTNASLGKRDLDDITFEVALEMLKKKASMPKRRFKKKK